MSTVTEAPARPATGETVHPLAPTAPRPSQLAAVAALTAAFVALPFVSSSVDQFAASPGNTWTEIALILLSGLALGACLLTGPPVPPRRRAGWAAVALIGVLFALATASIAWSVLPDSSWLAAGQMLAYVAVFAASAAVSRRSEDGWLTLVWSIALAAGCLCAWSLLCKVFPATLAPNNHFGRLTAPYGYWNAIAVTAAVGLPAALWLGARRDAGRIAGAVTAVVVALCVAVLVLSYSRSADLAALLAVVAWLVLVPLRLRAAATLILGGLGGAVISAYALATHALTSDGVRPALQDAAGHRFGVLIAIVVIVLAAAGAVLTAQMARRTAPARLRLRVGRGLVGLVLVGALAAILGLATSHGGIPGKISTGWHELTNPSAVSGDQADRVLSVGSSRPLYWHQAIAVGDHAVLKGVGMLGFAIARLRYTQDTTVVFQAHSYVFEIYADLGVIGLAVTAALLLAWLIATARALGWGVEWAGLSAERHAERAGLATLAACALAFGIQTTIDYTWFFTGLTVPVLIAAGWIAGRGSLLADAMVAPAVADRTTAGAPVPARRRLANPLDRPGASAAIVLGLAATLAACWMIWLPLHSAQLVTDAYSSSGSPLADARGAHRADPLALAPYQLLSTLAAGSGDQRAARTWLQEATEKQPQNPQAWAALGTYLIGRHQWSAARDALEMVVKYNVSPTPTLALANQQITLADKRLAAAASGG